MEPSLIHRLEADLAQHAERPITISSERSVGGGSINDAYRLDTTAGTYFVKTNQADRFPSMFEAEADGLRRLREVSAILTPELISTGELDDITYLLMEWVESGPRRSNYWEQFGRELAAVHRNSADHFGLERDNYIGSLPQSNTLHDQWSGFFIHCRMEPQVKMARDQNRLGMGDVLRFERLYGRLGALLPKEPPALLHGDLWSGNFLTGPDGGPVLIDPAVYFGHREMDIAMTRLFGGFDAEFYTSYNEAWPMERGWEDRMDLCNLYPLLVHVNLFGGGYRAQVEAILRRFT